MFVELPGGKDMKDIFVEYYFDKLEDNLNSNAFAKLMYSSLIYLKAIKEIHSLIENLELKSKNKLKYAHLINFVEAYPLS